VRSKRALSSGGLRYAATTGYYLPAFQAESRSHRLPVATKLMWRKHQNNRDLANTIHEITRNDTKAISCWFVWFSGIVHFLLKTPASKLTLLRRVVSILFDSSDFEFGYWMDFPGGGAPVTGLAGRGVLRFVSVMRVVEEPTLE
jgi:hypothetical protein